MSAQDEEVKVATVIITADSNTVVRDLVYCYSGAVGSGSSARDFDMQITDPDNPLLLFDYRLSSHEFPALREEQQLCFEFVRFPSSVTRLLATCKDHESYRAVIDDRNQNRPFLQLQQTTKFSLITHLKLPLVPASDDRLKSYLSDQAKRFKALFEAASEETSQQRNELSLAADEMSSRCTKFKREIDRLKQEHSAEVDGLRAKFEKMLEKDRRRGSEAAAQQSLLYEQKEADLVKKFEDQASDLQARLSDVTSERARLAAQSERQTERIGSLETQLNESRARVRSLDEEMRALQQSQIELRSQNSALTADLAATAAKLESATLALQEKASFSGSQGSVIDSLRAELSAKEAEINKMQQTIADLAEQAKDRNWIAEKSKKVIAKHQDDIRKLIQHHNERKAEWERKGEAMQAIERENVRYHEQIRALELALKNSEAKLQGAAEQIEELGREMDKIAEERKADRQMISYLEGQLNRKGEVLVDDADDDQPLQAQSPKGFKPVSLGGPFSPYVPKFSYPETGSVFDAATFFV